jgi:hypothetical protein
MQGSKDGSTRQFGNVFLTDFLARLRERNEPSPVAEADVAGPWTVEEFRFTWYGVYRRGESSTRGHLPTAVFADSSLALLAAAALPGTGRDALFHLQKDPTPDGYALESGGEVIAHLAHFDEKLVDALHTLECLLRSPEALANLLEAAGSVALERAGAILGGRLEES